MSEVSAAPVAEIVKRYIALRDKKAELKAEYDGKVKPVDEAMTRIENYLLKTMQDLGVDSVKTEFGTPYISTKVSHTSEDWPATLNWAIEGGHWNLFEKRVNKTFVDTFIKEHDDLPPGVKTTTDRTVNIRRS